jgi:hypothetical protein
MQRTLALVVIAGAMAFALAQFSLPTAQAATPIPGGANQLKGISGGLAATLFNGKVRIRKMTLRAATPAEYTPDSGKTGLMFSFLVSNGTSKERSGQFSASIVDADAVTIDGGPLHVYDAYYSLQPGAAGHATLRFIVPSGFKAVKILLQDEGSPTGPVFRINLKAADLPAAPTPAAS